MKSMYKTLALPLLVLGLLAGVFLAAPTVEAINVFGECANNPSSPVCASNDEAASGFISNLVGTLLFILGTIAVIMIIVGGFRYVTSNGDQAQLTSAKNTILYSAVGLAIAISAYAIVDFVLRRI